eukprot:CAMPEP_0177668834 /NCGR_PEP_ID=MMETSP0447-20121125/23033_1 /TAXON_ID=0 /ORGANISM="Stygamoeba regulata, Strain BSH-02190019" /LENGTH=288 /DNA_ID=CAMNT_0019175489 /DNA_START=27 /DNA_END=893 /DNA_ORIENTATION=+
MPTTAPAPAPAATNIYSQDKAEKSAAGDIFRMVEFSTDSKLDEQNKYSNAEFRNLMNDLFVKYKPSSHPFFANLKAAPAAAAKHPEFLSQLYLRYQAAMHATRASVWLTPYLDTPRLRQRKALIIVDDDTVNGGLSHHKQLENLFRYMGASPIVDEERFGDLQDLEAILDKDTFAFCKKAWELYVAGTGAWSVFEVLSDNWQSALANSFLPHYGKEILEQQYFDEIASGHVEILHMLETVSLTEDVLHRKPHLLGETMAHAVEMAQWSYKLWDNFDALLKTYVDKTAA